MTKILISPKALSSLHVENSFYQGATQLRTTFTERFQNLHQTKSERFCWDYWHIPEQYRLLRTPAESFFKKNDYQLFLSHLLQWGRQNLGCQMISHPWLSLYFDGCYQALHSDVPHGPWSFVYSLTPWESRRFTGGETLIAKPKLLRYFSELKHDQSDEHLQLFQKIEPKFNRLTVFDPRYPHGVQTVKGEEALLASRLVIHGWFTEPRPMIEGALSLKKALKPLDQLAYALLDQLTPLQVQGLFSLRLEVLPSGNLNTASILCAHLIDAQGMVIDKKQLQQILRSIFSNPAQPFPSSSGKTWITLPIEFK